MALFGWLLLHLSAAATARSPAFQPTALFGDHMVLQATDPNDSATSAHLAGLSAPGATVALDVAFDGKVEKTFSTTADADGRWDIGGLKAAMNQGPFVLTLRSIGQTVAAKDVWFGNVVMCTGQSNMELSFPDIYDNVSLINSANTPEIRLFQVKLRQEDSPLPVGSPVPSTSNWTLASPRTVKSFSAICYLTAKAISDRIMCESGACYFGLIETCEGATDIQSWMSAESREQARKTCWAMPGEATPAALPPIAIGKHGSPSQLFNGMIAPLAGYSLSSILWDQGEDNVPYCSVHQYDCLYQTMMSDWRQRWNQSASNLPVTSVQLGGFIRESKVATIRLAQSDSLPAAESYWSNNSATRVPLNNSAVAASYDLCSPEPGAESTPGKPGYACWVHARNKSEISRRVALQHLQLIGMTGGEEWSGPVVRTIVKNPPTPGKLSPTVTIHMDPAHSQGLVLAPGQGCERCCNQTASSKLPAPFQVQNDRGDWLAATGMQEDGSVLVVPAGSARTVGHDWLFGVRYAMIDEPQCVLYNSASLPALPFQLPVPWTRPDY